MENVLKVGSEVRIDPELKVGQGRRQGGRPPAAVVDSMLKYAGRHAVITRSRGNEVFALNIDRGEWFWTEGMFVPLRPSNYCSKNVTYCEGNKKIIFNNTATVCILDFKGNKFKGVAKCSPKDIFVELIGRIIAEARAEQEKYKWVEKHPREAL